MTKEKAKAETRTEKAAFAAGCFWGVEEKFRNLPGVKRTTVGYMGGITDNPTYSDVCAGRTGHAETVLVEYDPGKVSYRQLVGFFFSIHDPTSINSQGPDYGSQYRSAIFYANGRQKNTAELMKKELNDSKMYMRPIATEIKEARVFWPAEEYHQKYLMKSGAKVC